MKADYPNHARVRTILGDPLPPGYKAIEMDYLDLDQLAMNIRLEPQNAEQYIKELANGVHPDYQRRLSYGD